ncbi:FAD-dependent monooxygenase [Streptomyces sp. NPDC053474]|uniref:FAD-dependent monooxygenase n=1 Tax=Streptomyces sp. NPDC053474 TaxID=3365704 RepID=UPI0037D5D710
MTRPRILIVGAGIAGLTLTHALRRNGLYADIIERSSRFPTTGAGLYLPANAVRTVAHLGLGDALARRGHPITRQRILDHRDRHLATVPVHRVWGDVGACLALTRGDMHTILRDAVGDDNIRLGTGLSALAQDGTATFTDATTDRYDLVVGADGANSTVRQQAFGAPPPRFLGQICWRFLARNENHLAHGTDWTVRLGSRGRSFLTVPLGNGTVYCYADTNSDSPAEPTGDWRSLFEGFAPPVLRLASQGATAHFAPLYEAGGSDWVRPHAVLIGDAAHACSPSMAQGAAMALEDAHVLASMLGTTTWQSASDPGTLRRVLKEYQLRREARVRWVLEQNKRRDATRNLPAIARNMTLRLFGARLLKANHAPLRLQP